MPKRIAVQRDSAAEMLRRATLALQMRRIDEAARLAKAVLTSDRNNLTATEVLSRSLLAQNQPHEAVATLTLIARRSGDAGLNTLLARALAADGQREASLNILQHLVTRRPLFLPASCELAERLNEVGRYDDSIAVLKEALELAPEANDLRMQLGRVHLKKNDRVSARNLFQQVRVSAPTRHDAIVALAQLLTLDGEHAGAASLFQKALGMRPGDVLTRISLGRCLLNAGKRVEGEAMFRAAIRSAPDAIGLVVVAMSAASHGRCFLRPSAAVSYLTQGRREAVGN